MAWHVARSSRNNANDPDATCRLSCAPAGCGDGIMDTGDACDDGSANSDTAAGACRSTCEPATSGDGVVDTGEACDTAGASATCSVLCETVTVTVDMGVSTPDGGIGGFSTGGVSGGSLCTAGAPTQDGAPVAF